VKALKVYPVLAFISGQQSLEKVLREVLHIDVGNFKARGR
jgi:hypothetical protein